MESIKDLIVMRSSGKFLFLALILITFHIFAKPQQPTDHGIPERPVPHMFVNDLAGILTKDQTDELNKELIYFDNTTLTPILVVTTDSFRGYDMAQFAVRLGEEWEIGETGFDNGVVILVKPQREARQGGVYIAIGYGLQEVIPQNLANRIIEYEMIPRFRQNDFYGGISSATDVIRDLIEEKYTPVEYLDSMESHRGISNTVFFVLIIAIMIIIIGPRLKSGKLRRVFKRGK